MDQQQPKKHRAMDVETTISEEVGDQQQQEDDESQQPIRIWPPVRSDPIVIGPPTNNTLLEVNGAIGARDSGEDSDSSSRSSTSSNKSCDKSEEVMSLDWTNAEEETTDQQQLYHRRKGKDYAVNSLPSRLLWAPWLGSVSSNSKLDSSDEIPDTALPPPMVVLNNPPSDFCISTTNSYGSLRDSHLKGRFLDGPSSYRDSRTGNIRRIQHRVRFGDHHNNNNDANIPNNNNSPMSFTAHAMGGLSIGERMMQFSKMNTKAAISESTTETLTTTESTLSKLMESCLDETTTTQLPQNGQQEHISTLDDVFLKEEKMPLYALSTSLTGLEILQGAALEEEQQRSNNNNDRSSPLERARNDSLARSLSAPLLVARQPTIQEFPTTTTTTTTTTTNGLYYLAPHQPLNHAPHRPFPPYSTIYFSNNHSNGGTATPQEQELHEQQQQQRVSFQLPSSNNNPDTEEAFQIDF